jgi:4-amino-4-deoxy-L-arabinose transferase-like glycosyltransferase
MGAHLTPALPLDDLSGHYTATVVTPAFSMSVKLIFMIVDLVVGYLIFWIIRDITKDRRKAVIGFGLWFLCPFVITVGAVLGMFDTISVLMTLLAIVMLRKDRYAESGIMLCLAALTKFFPAFLILIFIAYIIAKNKENGTVKGNAAKFLIGIIVTAFIIFLPQILDGTLSDCFLFITSRVNEGMGMGLVGKIGGYVAPAIYVITFIVSGLLALRIVRNKDGGKLDGMMFDAFLITTAVMFLYPPLPQYILLLFPFILFALTSNKRYKLPIALLMIGTAIVTLSGGPMDLTTVSGFTDLLDINSIMHAVEIANTQIFGFEAIMLVGFVGYIMQYAAILLVLWVRFSDEIKRRFTKNGAVSESETAPDEDDA